MLLYIFKHSRKNSQYKWTKILILKIHCENGEFYFDILQAFSKIPAKVLFTDRYTWQNFRSILLHLVNRLYRVIHKTKHVNWTFCHVKWSVNSTLTGPANLDTTAQQLKTSLKTNEIDWQESITEEHTIARK